MDTALPPGDDSRPIPAQAVLYPQPMTAAPLHRRSSMGPFLLALLALGLIGSLLLNFLLISANVGSYQADAKIVEKHYSHERSASHKIAIIEVEGVILNGEDNFRKQIDHARRQAKDGVLKALVLRVDSPGGSVSTSDYLFHHLKQFREETGLPVIVSMGSVAASGGYYVAMAVGQTPDSIFAEPSTFTGSIGVIIPHYNLEKLFDKIGLETDSIASGPLKTMGDVSREMTPEEMAIFKALVDEGFEQFKDVIKEGRPKFAAEPEALDKLATGQIYTSKQAVSAGLVDKIGFLEDAINRAIELAKLDPKDVSVVRYKPDLGLLDALMGAEARGPRSLDLAAIVDATTPRAYYLWTTLPLLARSGR